MGLLDYADAAGRKFFGLLSQAPDNAKQMALAAYQLATDPNARRAAMSRQPMAFSDEAAAKNQAMAEGFWNPTGLLGMAKALKNPAQYGIPHRPPNPNYGAPAHDLTKLLPDDIYGPNAVRYYGDGMGNNKALFSNLHKLRGKPDSEVTIYRAVAKDIDGAEINPGDWVTLDKAYAAVHGNGPLNGEYKIIERKVKAKELFTSGDSLNEFGWHPEK